MKVPLPHISGSDVSGIVEETGEDVLKLKKGDRVVSHSNMSCRVCEMCTSGHEYDCNDRLIWGFQTGPLWGGFCQYAHLPEVNVVKIPDAVSFEDAAAISMVGMTAWHMLVDRAKIRPGQVGTNNGWNKWSRHGRNSNSQTIWLRCDCDCWK